MDEEQIRAAKRRIRRKMSEQKGQLTEEEIVRFSRVLAGKLFSAEEYERADTLFTYLSYNQEVRTEEIIRHSWQMGKLVAVPRIGQGEMRFYGIETLEGLKRDARGILQPPEDAPLVCDERALVIVPGLAFDRRGYRIGYGGGYYDLFLKEHPHCVSIALCYDFQLLDSLPEEAHDMAVGRLLTVSGEYSFLPF